jgi:hypothetical protein
MAHGASSTIATCNDSTELACETTYICSTHRDVFLTNVCDWWPRLCVYFAEDLGPALSCTGECRIVQQKPTTSTSKFYNGTLQVLIPLSIAPAATDTTAAIGPLGDHSLSTTPRAPKHAPGHAQGMRMSNEILQTKQTLA